MKRIAWLTDLHLNCLKDSGAVLPLLQQIREAKAEAVLVGGDTGEADNFGNYLELLAAELKLPTYFVLGNHDYYQGSIAEVRERARALNRRSNLLHWLPACGVVPMSANTTLVGHGGWGDGRAGEFLQSDVVLNDYLLIDELRNVRAESAQSKILSAPLLERLRALGDEAAGHFRVQLHEALEISQNVVVLTHVPPFPEACWHEGRLSDSNWAPHFVCQAVGEVLKDIMLARPRCQMTVYCGHTHSSGFARILNNLRVFTGQATYGKPELQRILDIE